MTAIGPGSSRARGLGRVVVYYALIVGVLVVAAQNSEVVRDAISGSALSDVDLDQQVDQLTGPQAPPVGSTGGGPWSGALLAGISMLGALAIMVPVTWVYIITRRQRGYHESVVHTLLILPVAVTGIVMIVHNNLALAFSLAGIVAAVRFRTTLEDTKDAVYVFLAIGVGISSGVQALGIALVLSIVFNAVVLTLWKTQFGNIYADRTSPLSRGDALAGPASAQTVLTVGDPALLEAVDEESVADLAARAARMERVITEERKKKKAQRANQLILVSATEAQPAQAYIEEVLEELSTRWKFKELGPRRDGKGVVLEYLAHLDGPGVEAALHDRLREQADGVITAAEIRSLKGLKSRA